MVEVHFPISEIRKRKLKVSSLWIKVDFNDRVLIKGKYGQTQRHAQEGRHMRTERETKVMCLQAEKDQGLHTTPSWKARNSCPLQPSEGP